MRASLENFRIFTYFLNLLFLSIFCWYFTYFVGSNDILVGLQNYTDKFPNVPTKLRKKALWGGGGEHAPPPPSGYANGVKQFRCIHCRN